MTTVDWIDRALAGESVWNLGQINKATTRMLGKLAKQGVLVKSRAHWQFISPLKTVWHLPDYPPMEVDSPTRRR